MEGTKQFTLRDALNECALLRYSKEYFSLLKESSELEMLETYIGNQQFVAEQAEDSVFKALNESGYFESAAGEDQLKQYIEATELKKKNIFVRHFPGPLTGERLRISIGTPEEMAKLLDALD